MERLLIADFEKKKILTDCDQELYDSMPKSCQKLAKSYSRIEIRSKLGRNVPLLIRCDIEKCIDLLLKYRSEAKVPQKNPYVFGLPGFDKHRFKYLRACILLRKFSVDCGAEKPLSLWGTILRKHVATICTNLNLSEKDVDNLAHFMGHDTNIHKRIYRQPTIKKDIVQMSQLLLQAQGDDKQFPNSDSETENEEESEDFEVSIQTNSNTPNEQDHIASHNEVLNISDDP
ncbi:uncharacterized protein LOC122506324 [Leptopilina heterotoma]|uniref:uncharacterized protein LOC122506324 n=1 Tax=Leptopilina heterotoma TaxID=63436 RepID=UPI001CA9649D|nr:uncharacterized protein LOC122506324 [Leptopilina heterotoma]